MAHGHDITELLDQWRKGREEAFGQLAPAVFDHLHQLASSYLRGERGHHTLQATALVSEVFLRLLDTRRLQYRDRAHFYAFAAKVMRRILVDHARRHRAQKRGDGVSRVELAPELAWVDADSPEMLDLDRALGELAELDEFAVQILEFRFFLGATAEETAELLGMSRAAVDRSVRFSVSWLHARLHRQPQSL